MLMVQNQNPRSTPPPPFFRTVSSSGRPIPICAMIPIILYSRFPTYVVWCVGVGVGFYSLYMIMIRIPVLSEMGAWVKYGYGRRYHKRSYLVAVAYKRTPSLLLLY
jgi:hypothetical protein